MVIPSATIATTGIRSPRIQGWPAILSGSMVMRSKIGASALSPTGVRHHRDHRTGAQRGGLGNEQSGAGSTSRRLTALAWPLAISHRSPDRQRPGKVEHTVRRLAGGLPFGGHVAVSQAFTGCTLEKFAVGAQFAQCLQGQGSDRAQCGAGEGGDLVLSVAAEIR